jgi:hypothetical protein
MNTPTTPDRPLRLAVYTTVYPAALPYVADWYRSVTRQTDRDFRLWIALDGVDIESARRAMGCRAAPTWILGETGDTIAQVRQRAWTQVVGQNDAVVMVDSDDVLHPSRVAAARAALGAGDLAGCALRVVDEARRPLGLAIRPPKHMLADDILPRNNIFGLSNSAYRADTLRRCLPVPAGTVLVDWFLATRAWLTGSRLVFDTRARMDYRQHGANLAQIRPPYTAERVLSDTMAVRRHLEIVQASPPEGALPGRVALLRETAGDIERFFRRVVSDPGRLEGYVAEYNTLGQSTVWWSCVAHPRLRALWNNEEESL